MPGVSGVTASRSAWAAAATCTVCSIIGLALQLITRSTEVPLDFGSRDGTLAAAVAFMTLPVFGALAATRRRESPIGWLFIATGATMAVWVIVEGLYVLDVRADGITSAAGRWWAWLANWMWIPGWGLIGAIFLLFPTGRLLSSRWRPVMWAFGIVTVVFSAATILSDGPMENYVVIDKPFDLAVPGLSPRAVKVIGMAALILVGVPTAVSLVLRGRRAMGDERQQIRWLAWAACTAVGILAVFTVLNVIGVEMEWAEAWVIAAVSTVIPIAAGLAVLKYRLYGIDVVITKTVVLGTLVAFVTLVYVAVVAGAGWLLGANQNDDRPGLSIAATVIAAVAFEPVRIRAQKLANRLVYGERATPYEVLSTFSGRMAGELGDEDALTRMAAVIGSGVGARDASVWLRYDDRAHRAAHWVSKHSTSESVNRHAGVGEAAGAEPDPLPLNGEDLPADMEGEAFAVRDNGELLGAITVTPTPDDPLDPVRRDLLGDLASQAGLVLRNVKLITELRSSRQRIVSAGDAERRRLERDIHDGAQQQLVLLAIKLRLLGDIVESDSGEAKRMVEELRTDTTEAVDTLRELAHGIYPPLLADQGLVTALRSRATKAPMPVEIIDGGVGRYRPDIEAAVYFCCLEGLQNAAKYAMASAVTVTLSDQAGRFRFTVSDDGEGFDSSRPRGSGLQNMSDRLAALDGSIEITSTPGAGTTLAGSLPTGEL